MSYFVNRGIKIAGIATAVPQNKYNVDESKPILGEEAVEKFKAKTGIKYIRKTEAIQTASDLGYEASNYLLSKLNIDRAQVGVLIFVSQSPDYRKPATACVLQYRLGLSMNCAAFDVGLGCSGFVYGNQIIRSMMECSDAEYGLLIVAETSSKLAAPNDKAVSLMFGDAGSAILYKNHAEEECTTLLKTDGSRYQSIIVPAGGFRDLQPKEENFIDKDGKLRSKYYTYMDGMGVFSFTITDVPIAMKEYLRHTNMNSDSFDYVFMHQANHMIIKQIARRLKVPMEKVPLSLDRYGNTSGVTIPLTICDALGNKNSEKVKILASGFGIGLSLGVTSFAIDTDTIFPIIETDSYYAEGRF